MTIETFGGIALVALIAWVAIRIAKQRNGTDPKGGGNGRDVEDK